LIIKRGVGLVTIGFVLAVVVLGIELVWGGNIGGVELPDDERISDIEINRSLKTKQNIFFIYLIDIYSWLLCSIR
jgi:hypothetical protein